MTVRTYTIYHQPELPRPYRVREFLLRHGAADPQPGEVLAAEDTLGAARAAIPIAADYCFPRSPNDAPEIVETWI